jgi:ribose transport system substrate-binding protein
MNTIKKAAAILLALLMVFGFAACGGGNANQGSAETPATDTEQTADTGQTAEPVSSADMDGFNKGAYRYEDAANLNLRGVDPATIGTTSVTPADTAGRSLRVGFSQMEVNNTWRIVNNESIETEAEARGAELIYRDAQSSIEKQNRDIIEILNEGVDYLIIAPYEYEGLQSALTEAKERGVPVILSDREAAGVPGEDFVTAILGDFVDTGYAAGQALRDAFGDETINVVEITGTAGSSVARDLSKGFYEFAEQDGNINLIASADGNFGRAESLKAMENIVQSYNGQFNAVFGHVDDASIAAIQALKAAGLTPGQNPANGDIVVVSMSGYKDAFDAILAGDQYATLECTARFGPALFDIIDRLQAGEAIKNRLVMPFKTYDPSNAEALYNEAQ